MSFCTEWSRMSLCRTRGQSTIEAAFLLPVLFILLLLLLQPGIVLYDRMVMQGVAAEACRLLVTKTDRAGASEEAYRAAILRRLGNVPQHDLFHVHSASECSWEIEFTGDERSEVVAVRIANKLKPLPIVDVGATLLGLLNDEGCLEIEVVAQQRSQPQWVAQSEEGLQPDKWGSL